MPKSILIVDDEAGVTLPLEGFFQHRGYQIFRAFYGDQAIEQLERNRPELVILDLQMPGVNGIAVLEKIHKDYPNTKMLVITGYADQYQKELERFQPHAVWIKPVPLEELSRMVDDLLKEGNTQAVSSAKRGVLSEVRLLFVEGDEEAYRDILAPRFQSKPRRAPVQLARACDPETAFQLLEQFQPHLILVNILRLPIGTDSGRLAADLVKASRIPAEVILYSLSTSDERSQGEVRQQLSRLEEAVTRFLKGVLDATE